MRALPEWPVPAWGSQPEPLAARLWSPARLEESRAGDMLGQP